MNRFTDKIVFNAAAYSLLTVLAAVCVLPFVVLLSGSLNEEQSIIRDGYALLPREFSLEAYRLVFADPRELTAAYAVTISVTAVGTLLGLGVTALTGYVLSRRQFRWANGFSFFFYFTTLFSGGLVPWYILCVQYLGFKEAPLLAQIVPYLINVFYLIIMKTFMKGISDAILESAKIDGAGEWRIFARLVLPLSKPVLATIGLFIAIGYWNDWYLSFLFVGDYRLFSLQYYLYKMITAMEGFQRIAGRTSFSISEFPKESMKMAVTVLATGPILLLYPFVQRFFVKGITVGAVKG